MEAALKEREKRLEEVKQAKSQKQEVSPTVLAYKKEVGLSISGLMCRWRSILGDADHRCPIIIGYGFGGRVFGGRVEERGSAVRPVQLHAKPAGISPSLFGGCGAMEMMISCSLFIRRLCTMQTMRRTRLLSF